MNNSYSPFFSFILPAYKARYLDKSIESILSQTHKDFELVIVNDKSPQHLEVLINHYHDFRISYYENESNIGRKNLVAQWNRCLSYAKGEYIILASDDDVYDFRYLEEIYKLILKYPTCHVFRSRIALIDGSGEVFRKEQIIDEYLTFEDFFSAFVNGKLFSGVPFYCFQKKALMKGGRHTFPLAWHSDDFTVFKLAKNGIAVSTQILFNFRMSGISISTRNNSKRDLFDKLCATQMFYAQMLDMITENVSRKKAMTERLSVFCRDRMADSIINTHISVICCNFHSIMRRTSFSLLFILKLLMVATYKKHIASITKL